jgi:hypothetical protein
MLTTNIKIRTHTASTAKNVIDICVRNGAFPSSVNFVSYGNISAVFVRGQGSGISRGAGAAFTQFFNNHEFREVSASSFVINDGDCGGTHEKPEEVKPRLLHLTDSDYNAILKVLGVEGK